MVGSPGGPSHSPQPSPGNLAQPMGEWTLLYSRSLKTITSSSPSSVDGHVAFCCTMCHVYLPKPCCGHFGDSALLLLQKQNNLWKCSSWGKYLDVESASSSTPVHTKVPPRSPNSAETNKACRPWLSPACPAETGGHTSTLQGLHVVLPLAAWRPEPAL